MSYEEANCISFERKDILADAENILIAHHVASDHTKSVMILKKFPSLVVTVPSTSTSAEELLQRWRAQDDTEPPTVLDKLKAAYLNQSGDMLFIPREIVGQLIEELSHAT